MTNPAELYACVYVEEFPAQALLRLRPDMHSRPCVVMDGKPPSHTVCSLNSQARRLGLAHGMTRVEVDTFANPVVLSRARETEDTTKAILLECAGSFSPRIEERSKETAFLCGIDICGTQQLFGPPEALAQLLMQRMRSLGFTARITISRNFLTAVCLAKGLPTSVALLVIPPGEEAEALASLPISVIDIDLTQAETFSLWGIHTLGMLAELPENELIARMGQQGKRLRQLARGAQTHLFQALEPPFALTEKMDLDSPVEILESLLFVVSVMLDQLILRATARILVLASVTITLTLDGGSTHARTIRPVQPDINKQIWIKLLQLDLESHPPQAPILAVRLNAEPGDTSKLQLGLFSPQLPESSRLDITLARIAALVGEGCVGRAVLQDTHEPEAFTVEPFTIPSGESGKSGNFATRVAMRKLRPPEPASVTLHNSQPVKFFYRDRNYLVEHAYGPWLMSGNWWEQTLWRLEQWDLVAHSQEGQMLCCCMIRDLLRNQWQIEALYD